MADARLEFVQRWYERSERSTDPFDRFFCLWLCLSASAARHAGEKGIRTDNDGAAIGRYFLDNATLVRQAHEQQIGQVAWLAQRTPPAGGPVVDVIGLRDTERSRGKRSVWKDHWSQTASSSDEEMAEGFAYVVNAVRNNLSHGQKLYDAREDVVLLEAITPVIRDAIRGIEGPMIERHTA